MELILVIVIVSLICSFIIEDDDIENREKSKDDALSDKKSIQFKNTKLNNWIGISIIILIIIFGIYFVGIYWNFWICGMVSDINLEKS